MRAVPGCAAAVVVGVEERGDVEEGIGSSSWGISGLRLSQVRARGLEGLFELDAQRFVGVEVGDRAATPVG